jgi:general secretion pathway protein C
MEQFAKKYFWLVDLVFIALGSLISAATVNTFVAGQLRAMPRPETVLTAPSAEPSASDRASADASRVAAMNKANPFGAAVDKTEPIVSPPLTDQQLMAEMNTAAPANGITGGAAKPKGEPADCVNSPVALRLAGIIFSETRPNASMATLVDDTKQDSIILRIGDELKEHEARVIAIAEDRVVVRRGGRNECFRWDMKPEPEAAAGATQVQQVDQSNFVISQEELNNTMNNLAQVATQARVVPHFVNGKAAGFRFYSIKAGSIYEKIGLKSGDVVQKINGFDLDSPDKALEVWTKLKDARNIDIEMLRNNAPQKYSYAIR